MPRILILGLLLVGAVVLLFRGPLVGGAESESEEVSREFTLSADPIVTVLSITHSGGLSGDRTIYLLHGDGRLRMERRGRTGTLQNAAEAVLSFEEMRDMVGMAVDHGLMEISQKDLLDEIKRPLPMADAGTMVVEIKLASYSRSGEELGPRHQTLRLKAPKAQTRFNPESEALRGMAELSEIFSGYSDRLKPRGAP